jgi:excisionase family DNA binding protein
VTESRRKRNLTIAEAAELTGLSRKAMARRVERGSIRSVLRSGRRLIPRSELVRVGLLPAGGTNAADDVVEAVVSQSFAVSENPDRERSLLEVLVRELLDRVQRQAGELAQYRAVTAEAATLRMEREVADLRLRLVALEGHGSGQTLALNPSDTPPSHPDPPIEEAQRPRLSDEGLWLPPRAAAARASLGGETTGTSLPRPPRVGRRVSRSRILVLVAEMLFIGLAALLAWLAGLGPVLAASAVAVAWLITAALELARWRA